jgi:hypothetical protein
MIWAGDLATAQGGSQLRDSAGFSPTSHFAASNWSSHPNTVVKLLEADCILGPVLRQAIRFEGISNALW